MSFDSDSESMWVQPLGRKFHADGVHSVVYRERLDESNWAAVKIVSYHSNLSIKPHDIVKEANVLSRLDHPHIVTLLDIFRNEDLQQYELRMPLLPLSLADLLESPFFSPYTPPPDVPLPPTLFNDPGLFDGQTLSDVLSRSISFQLVSAVAYLHNLNIPIAHRDIKPGNVLISGSGWVKLIDFGIAWDLSDPSLSDSEHVDIRSPYVQGFETRDSMVCQVGSGSFRALELLFSPKTYNACATDLWSMGATLCSFFTPLYLMRVPEWDGGSEDSGEDEDEEDEQNSVQAFMYTKSTLQSKSTRWIRRALFENTRGEIGLIWSIFKVRGTPNPASWPDFHELPTARAMSFEAREAADLNTLLPNLSQSLQLPNPASPLDLIDRLLAYNPSSRIGASEALRHPWFSSGAPLLLPHGHPYLKEDGFSSCVTWAGRHIDELIRTGVEKAYNQWEQT